MGSNTYIYYNTSRLTYLSERPTLSCSNTVPEYVDWERFMSSMLACLYPCLKLIPRQHSRACVLELTIRTSLLCCGAILSASCLSAYMSFYTSVSYPKDSYVNSSSWGIRWISNSLCRLVDLLTNEWVALIHAHNIFFDLQELKQGLFISLINNCSMSLQLLIAKN